MSQTVSRGERYTRGGTTTRGRGRGYYGNQGRWRSFGWRGRGRGGPTARPATPPPSPKRPRLIQTTLTKCPYPHWTLYLPTETYVSDSGKLGKMIKSFQLYFSNHFNSFNIDNIYSQKAVPVHYHELINSSEIKDTLTDISNTIINTPELVLNSMGLAIHTVLDKALDVPSNEGEEFGAELGEEGTTTKSSVATADKYHIRLYGIEPLTLLRNIKAPLFGKCVAINGTVVRATSIKPLVIRMAFQCVLCQNIQSLDFIDGKYAIPNKCPTAECNSKLFTPLRRSSHTQTIDCQTIRLQEQVGDDRREAGRIPRTIDCELTGDLVDSCVPGDIVTVTAVVKATGSHDDNQPRGSRDKCTFLLYLSAISVVNNKSSSRNDGGPAAVLGGGQGFTTKDYLAVKEIHTDSDPFKLLVRSLCPTIHGHEMVKAGLLLGLFGGCHDFSDDKEKSLLSIRGNPHVLIVGDPGLGKSQMLQAAANAAPRGVYVSGNTSTISGLTVTLTKDGGCSDYALEAGALVLGDQGCCCIDEFDKMTSQHQALLESMEQQSISIAKAGIVCTLPARTSILAAANPVGGHYNRGKTVSENLKMNSALLSRFDLVFILLDKPDEEMDCILSKHVMSLHSGKNNAMTYSAVARRTSEGEIDTSSNQSILFTNSLIDRLKVHAEDNIDPIPVQLLRKYIGYARCYVHPQLNSGAAKEIQKFYLELRKQRCAGDSTPITLRQLESLIRLTQARARAELREIANEQDAKDVIEIMKFSMCDTYSDEFGVLDFQRSQHGSGMSQKSQAKHFISELSRQSTSTGSCVFSWSQLKETSQRIGLKLKSFEDFISSLNNQGYLLKKGARQYKLQTVYD